KQLKKPVSGDDLIFPGVDIKGLPKINSRFSYKRVNDLLDEFSKGANLTEGCSRGKFTTHCFRRGGAQHRAIIAQEKWSLQVVRWWGGWSENEGRTTIMSYILEEISRYEDGFYDMLDPKRRNSRHIIFMGEADDSEVVTEKTLRSSMDTVNGSMESVRSSLKSELVVINSTIEDQFQQLTALVLQQQQQIQKLLLNNPQEPQEHQNQVGQRHEQQLKETRLSENSKKSNLFHQIPNVKSWEEASDQWEKADFSRGLLLPLKLWTKTMRRSNKSLYCQRKLIGTEYARHGYDKVSMEELYGKGITIAKLMPAIRQEQELRKKRAEEGDPVRLNGTLLTLDLLQEEEEEEEDEDDDGDKVEKGEEHKPL
ncbi:hypothetical protein BGZ76_010608, partial [Entomortierella beljakovae]